MCSRNKGILPPLHPTADLDRAVKLQRSANGKSNATWIVTDKYNAVSGSKYKKASTGQLESTFSYSTNLYTILLLPDALASIMPRVSVGKPAPDFTATAVMDGKLKGTCLSKSYSTAQY